MIPHIMKNPPRVTRNLGATFTPVARNLGVTSLLSPVKNGFDRSDFHSCPIFHFDIPARGGVKGQKKVPKFLFFKSC